MRSSRLNSSFNQQLPISCYSTSGYYASQRTKLRHKYGIKSSAFCDCFCLNWSPLCTVCQDANELQNVCDYKVRGRQSCMRSSGLSDKAQMSIF